MSDLAPQPNRPRILSGMRPTGRLHLGNYMGALFNWVQLQNQLQTPEDPHPGTPNFDCFFFIADWHALTTDYADPSRLKQNVYEVALDFLSAGLDPERSTLFIQSHVPQHAELHLLLSMITPLSWLERVPSYKDQQEQLREKDLATYGFLGYPLLQSADILLYRPKYVPVGADQVAHVEITREIARRFNSLYGSRDEISWTPSLYESGQMSPPPPMTVLPEPQVLLTPSPKLPGTDGRKMSKSYGNSILLADQAPEIQIKIKNMTNGGQRLHSSDPGDPETCPVGDLHRVFSHPSVDAEIREGCRTAAIGCIDCKFFLSTEVNSHLGPIRERRFAWENRPSDVYSVLEDGGEKAALCAKETMALLRERTGLSRDHIGVRFEHTVKRVLSLSAPLGHNLKKHADWWALDPSELESKLVEYWLNHDVPVDVVLKEQSGNFFVTARGKRLFVAGAQELINDCFFFHSKPKSFESIVLLCWNKQYQLSILVIPQSIYVADWTAYKRLNKDADVPLRVRQYGETFFLSIADAPEVDVSKYGGQYAILR